MITIARKLRVWFPGATYHIMHRGVRRKPIFEDEMDYQVFLQILKSALIKYRSLMRILWAFNGKPAKNMDIVHV